jgi:hypothetical protein
VLCLFWLLSTSLAKRKEKSIPGCGAFNATPERSKSSTLQWFGLLNFHLLTVYFYRYMGALDVCCRLFSPGALARVRKTLSVLAGGEDYVTRQYLYRFRLEGEGNAERVYTLGSRGRDFLAAELGLPVSWYFRPEAVKHFSHAHVVHSLLLTRVMVAAERWTKEQTEIRLAARRISYELSVDPPVVEIAQEGESKQVKVIPDAWLLFERKAGGRSSMLLEVDRGREYQAAFKAHIAARIEFLASEKYRDVFGVRGVRIAYVTTGGRPEYRQRRLSAMCQWTMELLTEQHRENWADVFRFCSVELGEVYQQPLFDGPMWRRPGSTEPVSLFAASGEPEGTGGRRGRAESRGTGSPGS